MQPIILAAIFAGIALGLAALAVVCSVSAFGSSARLAKIVVAHLDLTQWSVRGLASQDKRLDMLTDAAAFSKTVPVETAAAAEEMRTNGQLQEL